MHATSKKLHTILNRRQHSLLTWLLQQVLCKGEWKSIGTQDGLAENNVLSLRKPNSWYWLSFKRCTIQGIKFSEDLKVHFHKGSYLKLIWHQFISRWIVVWTARVTARISWSSSANIVPWQPLKLLEPGGGPFVRIVEIFTPETLVPSSVLPIFIQQDRYILAIEWCKAFHQYQKC